MWSPKGQHVMIPPPAQPTKHDGIGAVNDSTGETVVLCKRHKRCQAIAEWLETLLEQHPTGTISVAWDHAGTPEDDEVEGVVRAAAGRLVWLYLPTSSPWLNPIERLWRQFRREVTHNALFQTVKSLLAAARGCSRMLCSLQSGALSHPLGDGLACAKRNLIVLRRELVINAPGLRPLGAGA
jgi:putative transposase